MILTENDKASAAWMKLKQHYEERLMTLRAKNDASMSEMETARLRGEISMVKKFLELGQPQIVVDDLS